MPHYNITLLWKGRLFHLIDRITKNTSNQKPGHIIGNVFIREQIESRAKKNYTTEMTNHVFKEIKYLGDKIIGMQGNSIFDFKFIQNNPCDWQSNNNNNLIYLKLVIQF